MHVNKIKCKKGTMPPQVHEELSRGSVMSQLQFTHFIPMIHFNTIHPLFSSFLCIMVSQTLTIYRGRKWTILFISPHYFRPLKKIRTFICNFACKITKVHQVSQSPQLLQLYLYTWKHQNNWDLNTGKR